MDLSMYRGASHRASAHALLRPTRYVRIPERLLLHYRHHPLAIAVYGLIGRLYLIHQQPIALSAQDITRYDPTISPGAAERALSGLADLGWLVATGSPGVKRQYIPSWGLIRDTPLVWNIEAACLARPRHVRASMLDLELFDTLIGRLVPHPTRAAHIARYLQQPALSLRDIGAYALLLNGIATSTDGLQTLGLVRDNQPQALPERTQLLALASQQALDRAGVGLNERGLAVLGIGTTSDSVSIGEPLFFVPPDQIGNLTAMIPASVIADETTENQQYSATQSAKNPSAHEPHSITWDDKQQIGTDPSTSIMSNGGGKQKSLKKELPNTPTVALLQSINVLPESIYDLMLVRPETVQAAINYVDSCPETRDRAARVVHMLRQHHEHGWKIPQPRVTPGLVDWAQEHAKLAAWYDEPTAPQEQPIIEPPIECEPRDLREELRLRLDRRDARLLDRVEIVTTDAGIEVRCQTNIDLMSLQTRSWGALRAVAAEYGGGAVRLVIAPPTAPPERLRAGSAVGTTNRQQ